LVTAADTDVVINEIMAANVHTLVDPQGEYDDWIELHNVTDQEVDLSGRYLTDDPTVPRKWSFPAGTRIPGRGFLLVWAALGLSAVPPGAASPELCCLAVAAEQVTRLTLSNPLRLETK
jgi:hypothetical protein